MAIKVSVNSIKPESERIAVNITIADAPGFFFKEAKILVHVAPDLDSIAAVKEAALVEVRTLVSDYLATVTASE